MGRIIEDKDLSEKHRKIKNIRRQIAEQAFIQIWNVACQEIDKFGELTGNEILSHLISLSADLSARFVAQMTVIANQDQAGVTKNDLANDLTQMIHAMLDTKEIKCITDIPEHMKHIKRL